MNAENVYNDPAIPLEYPDAIEALGSTSSYIARFTPGDEYGSAATPGRVAKSKLKECTLIRVGAIQSHYWNPTKRVWLNYRGEPVEMRHPTDR